MQKYSAIVRPSDRKQQGATLIELLVGLTIGLMTIAVAVGALVVSRGVSGTVSDASQIQQQASYAFRVIGQQIRQAASMRLDLAANKGPGDPIDPADVVAFTPDDNLHTMSAASKPIIGKDSPSGSEYKLSVAYQNYAEPTFTSASSISFFRDCLANAPALPVAPLEQNIIESQFALQSGQLVCQGTGGGFQPIARNVANFQVRYLRQSDGNTGIPKIQSVNAAGVGTAWNTVYGAEVCLELFGDEPISMPAGSTYVGCNGLATDMSSTGGLPANRVNRLHMTFRTTYQLRSQGLIG